MLQGGGSIVSNNEARTRLFWSYMLLIKYYFAQMHQITYPHSYYVKSYSLFYFILKRACSSLSRHISLLSYNSKCNCPITSDPKKSMVILTWLHSYYTISTATDINSVLIETRTFVRFWWHSLQLSSVVCFPFNAFFFMHRDDRLSTNVIKFRLQ